MEDIGGVECNREMHREDIEEGRWWGPEGDDARGDGGLQSIHFSFPDIKE